MTSQRSRCRPRARSCRRYAVVALLQEGVDVLDVSARPPGRIGLRMAGMTASRRHRFPSKYVSCWLAADPLLVRHELPLGCDGEIGEREGLVVHRSEHLHGGESDGILES